MSRLRSSAMYSKPDALKITTNADTAYHSVSRVASDHGACRSNRNGVAGDEEEDGDGDDCSEYSDSFAFFEDIAHASNGLDQLLLVRIIDLRSQPPHVHVDDVGLAVEIHVPHLLGDQRARQDFAGVSRQQTQQREFLGCQIQSLAGAMRFVLAEVDHQIADYQLIGFAARPASKDRANACQ